MRAALFWIAVVVIIAALRGVAYLEPDPSDAYRYAYVGAKWTEGWLPYRDLFENKPPAIYAINALAFAVSREHHWRVLYVLETTLAVITVLCLAGMVRQWVGRPYDRIAALVAAPLAFGLRFAYTGDMTEGFQVAFTVVGLWVIVVLAARHGAWRYVLGGCLIGIGSLFKPPGLAAAVAVTIWLIVEWLSARLPIRRCLLGIGLLAAGVLLPWLVAIGGFALQGQAGAMLQAALGYNRHYGQEMWRSKGITWVVLNSYDSLWVALPVLAAAGYVVLTMLRPARLLTRGVPSPNWRLLAMLWMLGDLGGALAGGRCYQHYFVPIMISASAVAALALSDATRRLAGVAEAQSARRVGMAVLILWIVLLVGRDAVVGVSLSRSDWRSNEARKRFEIAKAARAMAKPGDTLFTWGSAAFFFYEAWLDPIYPDMDAHRAYDFDDKARQVALDLMAAFADKPPRFIVTDVNEDHPQRSQPDLLRAFSAFNRRLDADYRPVLIRKPWTLYVRRDAATSTPVSQPSSAPSPPPTTTPATTTTSTGG
ncbi:MAG: glycosyltransferase family 39 protein [Phycisphaerae bacterium]|nr:glycosyltransferase family 39 protein [Phycisphaerae bacterium]